MGWIRDLFNGMFPPDEELYRQGVEYAKQQIAQGRCMCDLYDLIGFEGASDPFDQGVLNTIKQHAKQPELTP